MPLLWLSCSFVLLCSGSWARRLNAALGVLGGSRDSAQRLKGARSLCSFKPKDGSSRFTPSCKDSWKLYGRCVWTGSKCSPNCNHAGNQHAEECLDGDLCDWDGERCTFKAESVQIRKEVIVNTLREEFKLSSDQLSFYEGLEGNLTSPCKSMNETECNEIWSRKGAQCAWTGGSCKQNCLHKDSQSVHMCDTSFCDWTGSLCQFDAVVGLHERRQLCDETAGWPRRRMVDGTALQHDFYGHGEVLSSNQKLFCRGMLGDDYDMDAEKGKQPKQVILAAMMRCWNPQPGNRNAYWDEDEQETMLQELSTALDDSERRKSAEKSFPIILQANQVFGNFRHVFVGLTNRLKSTSTTYCQEFKYNEGESTTLDEHGCHFFKRSFQPLQNLTRCIKKKIQADPFKELWDQIAFFSQRMGNSTVEQLKDELMAIQRVQEIVAKHPEVQLEEMLTQWSECPKKGCADYLNPYERVVEIIKQVEWDSWEGLHNDEVRQMLLTRIADTLAAPAFSEPAALTEKTQDSIVKECFHVEPELDESGNASNLIGEKAAILKESLACHPLMADYQQVPHPPRRSLWPRFWPDLRNPETREAWYKGEGDGVGAGVVETFQNVHPLCSRIALAGLLRPFSRSKYPWLQSNTGAVRALGRGIIWNVTEHDCLVLRNSHCINFRDCWKLFLKRHAKLIHPACQPSN